MHSWQSITSAAEAGKNGDDRMRALWTRDFLMRRIDRCYLIAAWARAADRREVYLDLARYYRGLLAGIASPPRPHMIRI
jgi:hypothetical protein